MLSFIRSGRARKAMAAVLAATVPRKAVHTLYI